MRIIHHEIGRDRLYKIWNSSVQTMILYSYTDGGSIVFQDKIYPMQKGALCLIRAGKQHYTMPAQPSRYDRSKIFLSEEAVSDILKLAGGDKAFHSLFAGNSVVYAQIPPEHAAQIESIYARAQMHLDNGMQAAFTQEFFGLMTWLQRFSTEQICAPSDPVTAAIAYINENYRQPITLESVCRENHVSKYHFCRKFKASVGITVMQYVLKTRLAAAENMLAAGEGAVSEVSESCGFSSVSYFCQIFKKQTGISPSEYRKQIAKNHA